MFIRLENFMKIAGIVAEFNPFHNGHYYLIQQAKKYYGCDYVAVIMSGNFTQRGEAAIYDKFHRTRWALLCGADLVIELPVLASTASARGFADSAIAHLTQSGVITHLVFGCENDRLDILLWLAKILEEEPDAYKDALKSALKAGYAYPTARTQALCAYLKDKDRHSQLTSFMAQPNNILALEYLMALHRHKSTIIPLPVRRIHSGYHDLAIDTPAASASALRHAIFSGSDPQSFCTQFPQPARQDIYQCIRHEPALSNSDFSWPLACTLLKSQDLSHISDIDQALSHRILKFKNDFTDFNDFTLKLKHKSYTHTRLSRALMHTMLNITHEAVREFAGTDSCGYLRILGFRHTARPLLTLLDKQSNLPLITRPAKASLPPGSPAAMAFQYDLEAGNLYRMAQNLRTGRTYPHEFCKKIIII